MTDPTSLAAAVAHLRAFRSTFAEGDAVDEESGLTADDLTAIIDYVDRPQEDKVADALGDLA